MKTLVTVSRIAMWVMIGAIVLTFFFKGTWITVLWGTAATVCLVCILIVAFNKNNGRRRSR